MRVIYTCPKCGEDLHETCLATYPPQYIIRCFACGWSEKITKNNDIVRIPYIENRYNTPTDPCRNCANHPSNGGSGICHCILGSMKLTY